MSADTVYVLLFRGVGGATHLPTKPLRKALAKAGFGNVATYINSGNAILSSRKSRERVVTEVAKITKTEFGFDKAIYAVTRDEWRRLVENSPFPEATSTPKLLHAAVLAEEPDDEKVEALLALARAGERIAIVDKVAYLHTPDGFGTSKLAGKFDKGIGVPNTARNWNTVMALSRMAEAIG